MTTTGLVIAAGHATRLGTRDGSKELIPVINLPALSGRTDAATCPVAGYLLNAYRQAGIAHVATVYRSDKHDIPTGLHAVCQSLTLNNTLLPTSPTRGPVDTICKALPELSEDTVAFGFPDIIASPADIIARLLHQLASGDTDVVMALLPATRPAKVDLVATDGTGRVTDIMIKDARCTLPWTWSHLVWTPAFSRFLMRWNDNQTYNDEDDTAAGRTGDQHVAHALLDAIAEGYRIGTHRFEHGTVLDIGTPDDLALAQSDACRSMFP